MRDKEPMPLWIAALITVAIYAVVLSFLFCIKGGG